MFFQESFFLIFILESSYDYLIFSFYSINQVKMKGMEQRGVRLLHTLFIVSPTSI